MTVDLTIEKNVYGGEGMGRLGDGRVCFVPGVFAGERIRAELTETKKNYVRARCAELVEASADRVVPELEVPGMVYAKVNYAAELRFKEDQLGNFLQRLGQSHRRIEVIAGKSTQYRNKATYHVQRRRDGTWAIGYRKEFSHEVVDTPVDPLVVPDIARKLGPIRAAVTALLTQGAKSVRREVQERNTVTIRHTAADGVQWWFGDAPRGKELIERTAGLDFKVAADGFYQVNPEVGGKLVEAVATAYCEQGDVAPDITDLYCGVGVFGIACRAQASFPGKLIGVESVHSAIDCARRNAAAAQVKGSFFCERTGGSLGRIRLGPKSAVIVDPPRGGLEKNVPGWLAKSRAPRIFYVSCDPATLTRDLAALVREYRIARVRLFDMFPRTARFETLVELER